MPIDTNYPGSRPIGEAPLLDCEWDWPDGPTHAGKTVIEPHRGQDSEGGREPWMLRADRIGHKALAGAAMAADTVLVDVTHAPSLSAGQHRAIRRLQNVLRRKTASYSHRVADVEHAARQLVRSLAASRLGVCVVELVAETDDGLLEQDVLIVVIGPLHAAHLTIDVWPHL